MLSRGDAETYQSRRANASALRTGLAHAAPVCQPAAMTTDELRSIDGTILRDLTIVSTGRSYELARAIAEDGALTALKSLRGERSAEFDQVILTELDVLGVESDRIPDDGRAFETEGPRGRETLVAYRWIDGETLRSKVAGEHPTGLPIASLLTVLRDVAQALSDLHRAGFVHRCLSPEHVIVTPAGRAVLIGLGNAAKKAGRPSEFKRSVDDAYSAPEVRDERSGRFNTPRADVYGFGLLASYAATGERPTGSVHAPLTRAAFDRLADLPEGISLLIARCLQPLQKNRIGSMRQILPLLEDQDSLPKPDTPGFGPLALIAPWLDDDGPGALRVGHLSPGPLVDRPRPAVEASADPAQSDEPAAEEARVTEGVKGPVPWPARIISALVIGATLYIAARSIFGL